MTRPSFLTSRIRHLLPGSLRAGLAALLLAGGASLAAEPGALPSAEALLSRIEATHRGAPSLGMRFEQTYTPSGFSPTAPEAGLLTVQAPTSLRFDYEGAEGKVYTFDGTTARQYVAADRQLIARALTASERERLPLLFLRSPSQILARYRASVSKRPAGLLGLELTPREAGTGPLIELEATAGGVVRSLAITDHEGNRTAFALGEPKRGSKRPLTDFALAVPAGTRVITE